MKSFRFGLNLLAIAFLMFVFRSLASAHATRTWVSGVGSDGSPTRSRTAPCQTFKAALSQTAAGGESIVWTQATSGG